MKQQISLKNPYNFFDLTAQITSNLVVFPGDPRFETKQICSLKDNQPYGLCQIKMCNHAGTHIDFPSHVIKQGKSSSDFNLNYLMGQGVLFNVPENQESITKEFVEGLEIKENDIVFFSTSNQKLPNNGQFSQKYVYIEPTAAEQLVKRKVKIVGIDYISVDAYSAESLPTHKILLSQNILIVEGLCIENVPMGRYNISIAPIKIANMDGLPARVFCYK